MENGKKIVLEPVIRDFVDALNAKGGKPLYTLSPQDARQVLLDAQKEALDPTELYTDILTRDMTVPAGPSKQTSVRLYRPENTAGLKIPVVLYIHGGGWVLGNETTHDRMVRRIAHKTKCAVIFVNYTPAPEAQYPVQIEQCYGVFEYLLAHEDEFAVNASRIAVAGDSSGKQRASRKNLLSGTALPCHKRGLRHPVLSGFCGRTVADPRSNEMVLGQLCAGQGKAQRNHCVSASGGN